MRRSILLLILGLTTNFATAQQQLVFNTLQEQLTSEQAKAKSANSVMFYELNEQLFENGNLEVGNLIVVNTMTGEYDLEITRVSEIIPGIISVRAASNTDNTQIFSFSYANGELYGLLHESLGEETHFNFDTDLQRNFLQKKDVEPFVCNELETPEEHANHTDIQKNSAHAISGDVFGSLDSETTIDILAVYTNDAADYARQNRDLGGIDAIIAQSINLSQTALDNNNIPVTFRVVHTHQTDYSVFFSDNAGTVLEKFTNTGDGDMDEVHSLRDQYGADLAVLYANITSVGGIAWRNQSRLGNPAIGFSLNNIQIVTNGYVVMHEIGHNIGLAHSRTQTQNASDNKGGVFQESVGYQVAASGITTVMGYQETGIERIPYMSDPTVNINGTFLGSNSAANKVNGAQTIRRMKDVIASYRATKVDPPISELSTNSINVNLTQGESITVPFEITNSGNSDLAYDIDFYFTEGTILKEITDVWKASKVNSTTLYNTGFETTQGYVVRDYEAIDNWRIYNNKLVTISNQNPASGSGHMRLESDGTGGGSGNLSRFLFGPYFGALPFGSYRVTFDVSVSDVVGVENEQFEINFVDSKTDDYSSGITITGGNFFILGRSETGRITNFAANQIANPDQYYNIEIDFNSVAGTMTYSIDGNVVGEYAFAENGNIPAEVIVVRSNNTDGAFLDIDNLKVVQYESPYSWLSVNQNNGYATPGSTSITNMNFNTSGVDEGVYTTTLVITTNEDGGSVTEIPITLTVSGTVSNEEDDDEPSQFILHQNYPNPFNPTTNIEFSIPNQGIVSLKVFNSIGQEIATLVNTRLASGSHSITFDASGLSNGLYFYALDFENTRLTRKMMLVK